jgi:AcrR family transcriptional regulator
VAGDTKQRLVDGALEVLRREGLAGASARVIASAAGANQALVFYHFGTVHDLLAQACRQATATRVAVYRERFAAVRTFRELLRVGRELHATERAEGNVAVLSQLLAGAQTDPGLAPVVEEGLRLWITEVETVLARVIAGQPFAELVDVPGLARAVSAAFVGIELYEGVDRVGAERALDALDQLAILLEATDGLGPVARRALRATLRRAAAR